MKHIIAAALVLSSSHQVMADGFVCQTADGNLNIKVYNQVLPDEGTRTAAVMVLSDPNVQHGRKTIARFKADNEVLSGGSARYVAKVDLRYSDSKRKGELIVVDGQGTKLGQLETIAVDLDFSYAQPVEGGEAVAGLITLTKRNGSELTSDLQCVRYKKD